MSLWTDPDRSAGVFGARKGEGHVEAVEQVKDWTRARFSLGAEDVVVVNETEAKLPGFPPRETAVTFWTADRVRHHYKVFKPVADVAADDIPPAFLKASLALAEGIECACC